MSIEESQKIDLITEHPADGYVALIMIEESGWDDPDVRARQLQDKLNVYLSYVLDGQFSEEYPELVDKRLRVQLDCLTPAPLYVRELASRMKDICERYDIDFVLNHLQRPA